MNRVFVAVLLLIPMLLLTACATHSRNVSNLRLGMTPEEALDEMGRPYAIRSSKVFRDGTFTEVWEYIPGVFSVALFADRYDKSYWLVFDNGKLVQWGEPGDFTGSTSAPTTPAVTEYVPERRTR
jgi:hypothetical protein